MAKKWRNCGHVVRKKYNLEIAFVFPHSNERIADWFDKAPESLQTLEQTKDTANAPAGLGKDYAAWAKAHFPKEFKVEKGKTPTIIPMLVDADRTLSKRLKLFTQFWDNVQSDQNVASFFLVDKKGFLQYKHIGQMTEDRPDVNFILDCVQRMN